MKLMGGRRTLLRPPPWRWDIIASVVDLNLGGSGVSVGARMNCCVEGVRGLVVAHACLLASQSRESLPRRQP
jgi:hypothetical protein